MIERKEFEMTDEDMNMLLEASQPVVYMVFGGHEPRSPQENANVAWASLGRKMGFDHETVRPVDGKSNKCFTAVEVAHD